MLGATQAAERWARRQRQNDRAKGFAIGYAEGRALGRKEQRAAMCKRLSEFAGRGMTPEQVRQIIAELADGTL